MADASEGRDKSRNGWDEARLRAYIAERDDAVNAQHRLGPRVQTGRVDIVVEGCWSFDPHSVIGGGA